MRTGINGLITIVCSLLLAYEVVQADIITDGSLGTEIDLSGPNFQVEASLGIQAGSNLFHSFREFTIATDESATFNGPTSVENIISRVTGGSASHINGALRSTIEGADLYLINPKGVLFGKDAQINIPGSLYVSTADQLRFADNNVFSATPGATGMLTVAAPAAFGFIDPSPATIQINAKDLVTMTGESLNFVGGDIEISRTDEFYWSDIGANDTDINLVSGGGNNQVDLIDGRPELGDQIGGAVSLDGAYVYTNTTNEQGKDNVHIQAKDLILSGGAAIFTRTYGSGDAGSIDIEADRLLLTGSTLLFSDSNGSGNTGDIGVRVNDLNLLGGAEIFTRTHGLGNAGSIDITAENQIKLDDGSILSRSVAGAAGHTGDIHIQGKDLVLSGSAQLFTQTEGSGDAGMIDITANQITLSENAKLTSESLNGVQGHAGDIDINADQLFLTDSALLFSDSNGSGNTGDIDVRVDDLNLSGGAQLFTRTYGAGNTGKIDIIANQINVSGEAMLLTRTLGLGEAESIDITADQIHLSDRAYILSMSESEGNAGDIGIRVKNIGLSDNSEIFIRTVGSGRAGKIEIKADQIDLGDRTFVSSFTLSGSHDLGDISLEASRSIKLTESAAIGIPKFSNSEERKEGKQVNSGNITITTPYLSIIGVGDTNGDGDMAGDSAWIMVDALPGSDVRAGRISINSDRIHMENGATISAESRGQGGAGDIHITGTGSLNLKDSYVSTNSASAKGGDIYIDRFKQIDLQDSRITTSVSGGDGNGGNITMSDIQLMVLDSSHIRADSAGASGGRLDIRSTLVRTPDSSTTARGVAQAQDGEVIITDEINLDQAFLDSELNFLTNEIKAPCSVAVSEESVVLSVDEKRGCLR